MEVRFSAVSSKGVRAVSNIVASLVGVGEGLPPAGTDNIACLEVGATFLLVVPINPSAFNILLAATKAGIKLL